ncbi:uncharacterized protein [Magallana gigas]|uniref:uncharacterized protein n=1 Tax=Magallana gigas TaxID=29159 RepID=UPI0033419989
MNNVHLLMGYVLLLMQLSQGISRYCQEAVDSAESVRSCPTSKEEWEIAAWKKNCSKIASQQNCSSAEKFQYHCVLNGYRNETLEVCAPSRIIFGHCVEFNLQGGVIQEQYSSPCNDTFPRCDKHYSSSTAYKYPNCYQLVSLSGIIYSKTTMKYHETSTTDESHSREFQIIVGITAGFSFAVCICACIIRVIRYKTKAHREAPINEMGGSICVSLVESNKARGLSD